MARAKKFRRNDLGAGWPNSVCQRCRSSRRLRLGNRPISDSRATSSIVPRGIRSGLSRRRGLFALGGLALADPVGSDPVDLFGEEGEFQLLAYRAGEKSAHRMLLPLRLFHQGIQCRPLWALKEGQDLVLFGA